MGFSTATPSERANLVLNKKSIDGIADLWRRLISHFSNQNAYTSHILNQVKTLGQAIATSNSLGISDLLRIPYWWERGGLFHLQFRQRHFILHLLQSCKSLHILQPFPLHVLGCRSKSLLECDFRNPEIDPLKKSHSQMKLVLRGHRKLRSDEKDPRGY